MLQTTCKFDGVKNWKSPLPVFVQSKRATKNRDFFQIPVCIHVFSSFKNTHTTVQTGGVIYWNMQTQMEQKVIQAKSEF